MSSYADMPPDARMRRTDDLASLRGSDAARWSQPGNLLAKWSLRGEAAASLISAPMVVLDLGCGKMDLERSLLPGVTYMPSDLVRRDERTIVCDLNAGQMPDVPADVVTMLGVLEYIHEPASLLRALAQRWPRLIVSYNPSEFDAGRDRRLHGWFNAYRSAELVVLARAEGWEIRAIAPLGAQRLYDFAAAGVRP